MDEIRENSEFCKECGGKCCELFVLPGTKEELSALKIDERTIKWVRDEIIQLTNDELRQTGMISEKYLNQTIYKNRYYRCKLHDKKTGLCTDYDNRPRVCRIFPSNPVNFGTDRDLYECKLSKQLFPPLDSEQQDGIVTQLQNNTTKGQITQISIQR